MNEPARFLIPPSLLAQLRERRQQRARRRERPPVTEAAAAIFDSMEALHREVEDRDDAFRLDGSRCSDCDGERWDTPLHEHGIEILCRVCRDRGWMATEMLEAAKALGVTP